MVSIISMTTPGLSGVYKWLYAGGSFTVCLRPSGVFYCKEYSSSAQWVVSPSGISIDWKNYGQYELNIVGSGQLEGSIKGKPASWRKMSFLRPFDECENLMMGNGAGTAWNFEYDKGSFEVEFRCDGFNHFICQKYPAHSHWSMEENKLLVNWDRYGDYELVLNGATKEMSGCKKGEPSNWRKLQFIRNLPIDSLNSVPEHDHGAHVHGEHCNH